jgi:hypothetical protein
VIVTSQPPMRGWSPIAHLGVTIMPDPASGQSPKEGQAPVGASHDTGRSIDPQLVEYLVVVVPDERSVHPVLDAFEELASGRQIVVLDAAVVTHDLAGSVTVTELPASCRPSLLATPLGVLSEHDLKLVAQAIQPGNLAIVVVVQDDWARPLAEAVRAVGGQVAGGERIPPARLQAVFPMLQTSRRDAS